VTPEADHVEVIAAQLHAVQCRRMPVPYLRSSKRHRGGHVRLAKSLLNGLADAGYALVTVGGDL
jgi:hypothetical protein